MEFIPRGDVLVVDDDEDLRNMIAMLLESSGFTVATTPSGDTALAMLTSRPFDVALVDLQLPVLRGSSVIAQARALRPDLEAVVITGNNTFEAAVEALRAGAYDCIQKPFSNDHLVRVIEHAVERRRLRLSAVEHEARMAALSTLHAVARASSSSLVADEILDAALTVTLERLGADAAAVGFIDAVGATYARARTRDGSPDRGCLAHGVAATEPLAAEVIRSGACVERKDVREVEGETAAALAACGYISAWWVPVASVGRPLGAMLAAWRIPRASVPSDMALLRAIGEEIGPSIQNARIHAQARLHATRLRAIHDLVRAINSERDIDAVLSLLVSRAAQVVGATDATVLLPTADGTGLQMRVIHGAGWTAPVGTISPIVGSLNGLVFRAGHALVSPNMRDDPRVFTMMREHTPAGPSAVIPLLHGGTATGTLCVVDSAHLGRVLTDDDLSLLGMLAEHAAVAIENARLHAIERAQNAVLEARVEERTRALREAQEQLVRRERLAILGRMAGSVSHEIRNPLGVLKNSLYFLRMLLTPRGDDEALRHVDVMESEVDRANGIVCDLLDYARVRAPVLRPVPLPALLSRALAGVSVPAGVTIVRDFAPEAPYALADADQLLTVFANLVRNALQAMTHGGKLTLRVTRDARGVLAEVTDSGPGISPEIHDRLFEPLVTTKAKGLGLGLATAKNLVEVQHGTITVDSHPGVGASFMVRLPAATSEPVTPRAPTAA